MRYQLVSIFQAAPLASAVLTHPTNLLKAAIYSTGRIGGPSCGHLVITANFTIMRLIIHCSYDRAREKCGGAESRDRDL